MNIPSSTLIFPFPPKIVGMNDYSFRVYAAASHVLPTLTKKWNALRSRMPHCLSVCRKPMSFFIAFRSYFRSHNYFPANPFHERSPFPKCTSIFSCFSSSPSSDPPMVLSPFFASPASRIHSPQQGRTSCRLPGTIRLILVSVASS